MVFVRGLRSSEYGVVFVYMGCFAGEIEARAAKGIVGCGA